MAAQSKSYNAQSTTIRLILGLLVIFLFTLLVAELDAGISIWFKARGVSKNPFEYPLVAVILGLLVNAVLRATKTHGLIAPAIKT